MARYTKRKACARIKVENAFLTACGGIRTLEGTAEVSGIPGIDEEYPAEKHQRLCWQIFLCAVNGRLAESGGETIRLLQDVPQTMKLVWQDQTLELKSDSAERCRQ